MAILYTFQIVNPNNVADFPPSVAASSWLTNLSEFWDTNNLPNQQFSSMLMIVFKDEAELTAFSNELRLTDATLLADIASWKTAHGVDYITKYYDLPESSITVPAVI